MDNLQCVEEKNSKTLLERTGRAAIILGGIAFAALGIHQREPAAVVAGLVVAIPASANAVVTEIRN